MKTLFSTKQTIRQQKNTQMTQQSLQVGAYSFVAQYITNTLLSTKKF